MKTPLHFAAELTEEEGALAMVGALIAAGADPSAHYVCCPWSPRDTCTALLAAVGLHHRRRLRSPAVARALLAAGADPNAHGRDGQTPLHAAARGPGEGELLGLLVAARADLGARDGALETALHRADSVETVRALIDAKVAGPRVCGGAAHVSGFLSVEGPISGRAPVSAGSHTWRGALHGRGSTFGGVPCVIGARLRLWGEWRARMPFPNALHAESRARSIQARAHCCDGATIASELCAMQHGRPRTRRGLAAGRLSRAPLCGGVQRAAGPQAVAGSQMRRSPSVRRRWRARAGPTYARASFVTRWPRGSSLGRH